MSHPLPSAFTAFCLCHGWSRPRLPPRGKADTAATQGYTEFCPEGIPWGRLKIQSHIPLVLLLCQPAAPIGGGSGSPPHTLQDTPGSSQPLTAALISHTLMGFSATKTLFEHLCFQPPQRPGARRSPTPASPFVRFEPSC